MHDVNKTTNQKGDLTALTLDPCVSVLFSRMNDALAETKEKLKQSQEDYSAATFTREGYNLFVYFIPLASLSFL